MTQRPQPPPARVAHVTPGRIRLRVGDDHLDAIHRHLSTADGVASVTTNQRTGSVLIRTHDTEDTDAVLGDLDEIGNMLSLGMDSSEVQGMADRLGNTVAQLNQRIYALTGENLHLGQAVPAGMAGVGIWQTIRNGLGLELIPGPLLLWLAWDIYRNHGTFETESPA